MSFVSTPTPAEDLTVGRHRARRVRAEDNVLVPGAFVHKRRARNKRSGRLRVLATATIATGFVAAPLLTSPAGAHSTYTVRPGDTLTSVAQDAGISWRALYRANRDVISSPTLIYPGQTLRTGSSGPATPGDPASSDGAGSAAQAGGFAQQLLAEARRLEGVPYVYGGSTPSGFDCSGFTSYVFAQAGKTIPRTSSEQAAAATPISRSDLRPGDLIFYTPGGSVSHVAIYAGEGMVWEAPASGSQVRYAPIWDVSRSYGRF
jgi:cell wall-associated NlpC family hydrolase